MNEYYRPSLRRCRSLAIGTVTCVLAGLSLTAAAEIDDAANLANLSLEDLLNMEITTLSRKAEDFADAPAAIFVISQNDIARSGARTIPDILRMVPGMQVAQIDNSKWAVTARGANGLSANKLLVLMDGRSVYTPMTAGVVWESQDTNISDIERIEVIRGPGATMWGSNAVNGVVNIITKHSADTQGGSVNVITNDRAGSEALLRFGGQSENASYRFFAKAMDLPGNTDPSGIEAGDFWESVRIGTRVDWQTRNGHDMSFMGEIYDSDVGRTGVDQLLVPPYRLIANNHEDSSGGFGQLRWGHEYSDDAGVQVLAQFVREELGDEFFFETRNTFEVDLQHHFSIGEKHNLIWGASWRHSNDDVDGSFQSRLMPTSRTQRIVSAFIQDEFQVSEKLRVILGSKFENNTYSNRDVEIEPSIRFSYRTSDQSSVWGAISRSVRMPSRIELDSVVIGAVVPPGFPPLNLPLPTAIGFFGNPEFKSEKVNSYELGYRFAGENLIFDASLFFNDSTDIRGIQLGAPMCAPDGDVLAVNPLCILTAEHIVLPFIFQNDNTGESHGIELWASTEVSDWWYLQGAYTYFDSIVTISPGLTQGNFSEDSPQHQVSLRSSMDLPSDISLDLWVRYFDALELKQIDAYTAMDIRLSWQPSESIELAVAGRNLIAGQHLEFTSEAPDVAPTLIDPQAYIEFRWSF